MPSSEPQHDISTTPIAQRIAAAVCDPTNATELRAAVRDFTDRLRARDEPVERVIIDLKHVIFRAAPRRGRTGSASRLTILVRPSTSSRPLSGGALSGNMMTLSCGRTS